MNSSRQQTGSQQAQTLREQPGSEPIFESGILSMFSRFVNAFPTTNTGPYLPETIAEGWQNANGRICRRETRKQQLFCALPEHRSDSLEFSEFLIDFRIVLNLQTHPVPAGTRHVCSCPRGRFLFEKGLYKAARESDCPVPQVSVQDERAAVIASIPAPHRATSEQERRLLVMIAKARDKSFEELTHPYKTSDDSWECRLH